MITLECGRSALEDAVVNIDLDEHRHLADDRCERMQDADRRNAGFARLFHLESETIVHVCVAHLMTTSRDNAKTTRFPGEVRAGEIAKLRELFGARVVRTGAEPVALLLGDFNTSTGDVRCLSGRATNVQDPAKELDIATGFEYDNGHGLLHWSDASSHQLILQEAFSEDHKWGDGIGPRATPPRGTSKNADRIDWIDYCWHTSRLIAQERSKTIMPDMLMPNETYPSDHLALAVRFELYNPDAHLQPAERARRPQSVRALPHP